MAASALVAGVYPHIVKLRPKIDGNNNLGFGTDSAGVEYVLKRPLFGPAEFIGAAVCRELGVPHCRPAIVTAKQLDGTLVPLFGSIVEPYALKFNKKAFAAWQTVLAELDNVHSFSEILAVDLSLGNDDRHQDNWIVRAKDVAAGRAKHVLLAMDYANSWPFFHPAQKPTAHASKNTWEFTRYWSVIGIPYDQGRFRRACAQISALNEAWLRKELDALVGVWLTDSQRDVLCQWWRDHWAAQVIDVINALEPDGDWL